MKNNQPVTQREIPFPANCYLVSKTYLTGVITHANDAFVEISGFTVNKIQALTAQAVASMDLAAKEVANGIGKLRESVAGEPLSTSPQQEELIASFELDQG